MFWNTWNRWMGVLNLFVGGMNIGDYVGEPSPDWANLALGILCTLVGVIFVTFYVKEHHVRSY